MSRGRFGVGAAALGLLDGGEPERERFLGLDRDGRGLLAHSAPTAGRPPLALAGFDHPLNHLHPIHFLLTHRQGLLCYRPSSSGEKGTFWLWTKGTLQLWANTPQTSY